jgi:hypothetical protein
LLTLLLLVLAYASFARRPAAMVERPTLPVAFEHIDHNTQPCADCHHNFLDDTGGGACYNCHKLTPEVAPEMESMFHDFCRECHVQTRMLAQDSGPMRQCSLCHH